MSNTLEHAVERPAEAVLFFSDDQVEQLTDLLVAALDEALRSLDDTPQGLTVH